MNADTIRNLLIFALPLLIAIIFHEVSHGFVANKLGDPTARMLGRLTLNPIAHIDLFGTIILPLLLIVSHSPILFGYAKPVPINSMNFQNPRKGMALSAAAGPVTNILLAIVSFLLWKGVITPLEAVIPAATGETILLPLSMILQSSIVVNVALAVFNMIPIPPLDGGRILTGLLPPKQAMSFSKIERFGFVIIVLLLYSGIANSIIMPIINSILMVFQVH